MCWRRFGNICGEMNLSSNEHFSGYRTIGCRGRFCLNDPLDVYKRQVLINRFKETRRKHPLAENNLGSLEQAVKLEREILRPVREKADYIIDTSFLSPAQLKERISNLFLGDASQALMIHLSLIHI